MNDKASPSDPSLFVSARGTRLWLGEQPFRFVGTNCYFLQEEGAREALGWDGVAGRVDEAIAKAAALGMPVVRAWAFNDDPDNEAVIQRAPGRLSEAGLRGVDMAIAAAARHGVRLILSLCNYWPDYGGLRQYLRWHGYDEDDVARFFYEPAVVSHFAEHVERLLTRRNPLTGLRWGEDPAVLGWEPMNEARAGEHLLGWLERIVPVIREAAPDQLVISGCEGHDEETGPTAELVDVTSIHLYPETWGWERERFEEGGSGWIDFHADAAQAAGRPLLLGEFGLSGHGDLTLAERRAIYRHWLDTAHAHPAVAGACSWSFSTDERPDDWDEFSWTFRDGSDLADPVNRYADLFAEQALRWAGV